MQSNYTVRQVGCGCEFYWVELRNIYIFFNISRTLQTFLFDKNSLFNLFTQNYWLPKQFLTDFQKQTFFAGEIDKWALYINIWFKLICYEFWSGKLDKKNKKYKISKAFWKCIILWRVWHLVWSNRTIVII